MNEQIGSFDGGTTSWLGSPETTIFKMHRLLDAFAKS